MDNRLRKSEECDEKESKGMIKGFVSASYASSKISTRKIEESLERAIRLFQIGFQFYQK